MDKPKPYAFPLVIDTGDKIRVTHGMTLLDYFAGQALNGVIRHGTKVDITFGEYAEGAYSFAEAMLKEREKRNDKR